MAGNETTRTAIAPAIQDGHLWEKNEGYTVFRAREIEGNPTAAQLLLAPELPLEEAFFLTLLCYTALLAWRALEEWRR